VLGIIGLMDVVGLGLLAVPILVGTVRQQLVGGVVMRTLAGPLGAAGHRLP
jgi:hypothetical protein